MPTITREEDFLSISTFEDPKQKLWLENLDTISKMSDDELTKVINKKRKFIQPKLVKWIEKALASGKVKIRTNNERGEETFDLTYLESVTAHEILMDTDDEYQNLIMESKKRCISF